MTKQNVYTLATIHSEGGGAITIEAHEEKLNVGELTVGYGQLHWTSAFNGKGYTTDWYEFDKFMRTQKHVGTPVIRRGFLRKKKTKK